MRTGRCLYPDRDQHSHRNGLSVRSAGICSARSTEGNAIGEGGVEYQARSDAGELTAEIERCRREIAEIEALILAGHSDVQGLCMALSDWSAELRLLERDRGDGEAVRIR
jgi:hypothetical protein